MSHNTSLQIETLANGVTLICDPRPHTRSVSLGLWIHNGSRFQGRHEQGYAHLSEHLLFKSNGRYSAARMANLIDGWGGRVNAHTERQLMALTATVPAEALTGVAHMLQAMLTQGSFLPDECDLERSVVLRELAGLHEAPEAAMESALYERIWPRHPMGWEIIGNERSLVEATPAMLRAYWQNVLTGGRVAVTAVGPVELERLRDAFSLLSHLPAGPALTLEAPSYQKYRYSASHRGEQAHLMWAWPAPKVVDDGFYTALLANQILGAGVSSRLFRILRDALGLVYDISTWLDCYPDCGLMLAQTACDASMATTCQQTIGRVIADLAQVGPTAKELTTAGANLLAGMAIGADQSEESMDRLAREHFYLGRHPGDEERMDKLGSVDRGAIQSFFASAWPEAGALFWLPA